MTIEAAPVLRDQHVSRSHPARLRRVRAAVAPLILLALAIGGWQVAVDLTRTPGYLLPAPSSVAAAVVHDRGLLLSALRVTGGEMVVGFGASVAAGLLVAVAMHWSAALRRALLPLLLLSQTVPTVVFAPLVTIALGYSLLPKVVVVAVVCFFPVVIAACTGFDQVGADKLALMRSLGASRRQLFWKLELPSALPSLFAGARVAATYAAVAAVFAEWAGSSSGVGFVILQAQPELDTARIFAASVALCLLALCLYGAVLAAERSVCRTRPTTS
ncbi:MAG TPA: ABC transporter permease subunit [Gaiellaceae bacterium]|nr:ABC transporter permease subunit [Gaiellaceae bacterium]